jgi:hypothetical protein
MIILTHVLIAISSMAYAAYTFVFPAKAKFGLAYILVGLTTLSGAYLIVTTKTNMLQSCLTGLLFIGTNLGGILLARNRFARIRQESN